MNSIEATIKQLRQELNMHNHNYYVLNQPTISDMEFDMMMHRLEALEKEHQEEVERLKRAQQAMEVEARKEREKIIEQATHEKELMLEQAHNEIEIQRANLIAEVEDYLLDVALNLTERTLENYDYDETEIYHSLEVELEQMNNETH